MSAGDGVSASQALSDRVAVRQPLVSIVTPSFNQGAFIERTIRSVKNQEYPRIEHVIMDGASTDGTLDVLRRYEATYPLRWYSEPDKGQSDAVNKALALISGEIVGWLNSDDVYVSRNVVSVVAEAFANNPGVGVVYGNVLEIDEHDRIQRLRRNIPRASWRLLVAFNFISQPAVFFRRSALASERLNTALHFVMDYDLWLRLRQREEFCHLDRFLAGVRYHSGAKNLRRKADLIREASQVRRQYSRGGAWETVDRTVCKLLFRLYRLSAISRINELAREPWAVRLDLPSKGRVALRQVPPFGWLEKRLAVFGRLFAQT
jgi:glycosyltransferase involved in cell wall biosynthesis